MPHVPEVNAAVAALERDLRTIFGARLQCVIAYGLRSAHAGPAQHAHGHAHRPQPAHSMAVVDALTAADLRACADRAARWHDSGLAVPLLLTAHDFERSLDAFPLEFGAIVADHVVVSGRSPFDGARVDPADVRRACEVQARSHLLHLREGFMETAGRGDALAVLIVQSAPAFAALLDSVARLQGAAARDRGAVGRHVERALDVPGGIISDVLALADVSEIRSDEATRIFPAYLDAVERLVRMIDGWK